jgi:hypothetical protein
LEKLADAVAKTRDDPAVQKRIADLGVERAIARGSGD